MTDFDDHLDNYGDPGGYDAAGEDVADVDHSELASLCRAVEAAHRRLMAAAGYGRAGEAS